jgi:hypothetical protein
MKEDSENNQNNQRQSNDDGTSSPIQNHNSSMKNFNEYGQSNDGLSPFPD